MDKNDKTTNLSEEMEQVSKSEKMIPLSAVALFVNYMASRLEDRAHQVRRRTGDPLIPLTIDPVLVVAYDNIAACLGIPTSSDVINRMSNESY